jgi:guanylate kinase
VIAAPSGTGKTTLARALVDRVEGFSFSVSATTREARRGEGDGSDYHFRDRAAFEAMIAAGELAEWAEVHGELYGTLRAEIDEAAGRGEHLVLDIDVQGARQIRENVPEAVLVFVLPPSVKSLLARLVGRRTEGSEEVARRLRTALAELDAASDFDHVVVNDDLDRCLEQIRGIVAAQSTRTGRLVALDEVVEELRSGVGRVLREEYENVRP